MIPCCSLTPMMIPVGAATATAQEAQQQQLQPESPLVVCCDDEDTEMVGAVEGGPHLSCSSAPVFAPPPTHTNKVSQIGGPCDHCGVTGGCRAA